MLNSSRRESQVKPQDSSDVENKHNDADSDAFVAPQAQSADSGDVLNIPFEDDEEDAAEQEVSEEDVTDNTPWLSFDENMYDGDQFFDFGVRHVT